MLLTNTSPANSKTGKRIEAPIPTRRLLENALETNPTSVGPPELIIPTFPSEHTLVADKDELTQAQSASKDAGNKINTAPSDCEKRVLELQQELNRLKLKEVEKQQSDFE